MTPRIPLVDPDDERLDPATATVLRDLHAAGMDFNVLRALANHPALLDGFMRFSAPAYWGSSVDPALRELAYLTASSENRCHYWVPTHIALGRSVGLSEAKLRGLAAPDPAPTVFSPVERTVVVYARRLTTGVPIDDELYDELRRHFTLQQLMELCLTIGISNVVNRFHATFHTPLDDRTRDEVAADPPLPLPEEPGRPDQRPAP